MYKRYIYELPPDINKELCRLLDYDDDWKVLAGNFMKYSPFEVNEIERKAQHKGMSPTEYLFIRWGQLNHTVNELFILLYYMKHGPAMMFLKPLTDPRYHKLLDKLTNNKNGVSKVIDSANLQKTHRFGFTEDKAHFPVHVELIEKGIQMSATFPPRHVTSTTTDGSSTNHSTSIDSTQPKGVSDEFLKNIAAIPMMNYEELKEATGNWDENNLLGRGGFGQVFKGEWKLLPIAVKRLRDSHDASKELIREMCLNKYRHDNILPLYGYSLGGPEACLVYQLMAGGSLQQRLRCKTHHPPLTWVHRYRVAHGVARGLQYLHTMTGKPLIHGDIKPANILLDQCAMPKIGDFGLARSGANGQEKTHLMVSKIHGTLPYLPDEYLQLHHLSPAVDVFSYGVVMLEMATALPVLSKERQHKLLARHIHHLANQGTDLGALEDVLLRHTPNSNPGLCHQFISIGLHCTKSKREDRPPMLQVYRTLDAMEVPGKEFIEH